eukprot:s153_g59.t1
MRQPPQPQPPHRRVGSVTAQVPQPVLVPTPAATVTFWATVHDMREKEQLYLVGGVEELGSWDAARAKQMSSHDGKRWSIQVALRPHMKIQYKYIRISEGDDKSWVHWEQGPNSHDREFYWNGITTVQDDGEISSFLQENKELQKISYNSESQEIVAGGSNSVSVSTGWLSKPEDVPKSAWVCDMFDKMQTYIDSLERKLESQISELSHRQDGNEKSFNQLRRMLSTKISDVEDKIEETAKTATAQQAENTQTQCSLSEKQKAMHVEIDCLERRMKTTKDDSHKRLENLEKVIDSHKCDIDSHSKSLVRLQRQINDLDLKIPEADGGTSEPRLLAAAQVDLPSTTAPTAPPSYAARVDSQPLGVQPAFEQNEGLDEWNEVASRPDASKATSMDVEQSPSKTKPASGKSDASKATGIDAEESPSKTRPACGKSDASKATGIDAEQSPSKTRPACGKSDDLKVPKQSHPETKSAFSGFQLPPKPEDEEMAKICSKVEEELCEARRRDLPVDARKRLLRKSLLRLHPDKGKPSAGAIWIEDWKNTHIAWYYHPHPVPEDQQKYLTKSGSVKDP